MKRQLTWLGLIAVAATSFPATLVADDVWDRIKDAIEDRRDWQQDRREEARERQRDYYEERREAEEERREDFRDAMGHRWNDQNAPRNRWPAVVPATQYGAYSQPAVSAFGTVHRDVQVLADKMADELRRIYPIVTYEPVLQKDVLEVIGSMETLFNWAETGRPIGDLQAQFAVLDEKWHPLSYQLAARSDLATWIPQSVATAQQADDRLHALLQVPARDAYYPPQPPAGPSQTDGEYIRNIVSRLSQTTDHLVKDVERDLRRHPEAVEIARWANSFDRNVAKFHRRIAREASPHEASDSFAAVLRAWQPLHQLLQNLDRRHFEHTIRMANEINEDLHRLQQAGL